MSKSKFSSHEPWVIVIGNSLDIGHWKSDIIRERLMKTHTSIISLGCLLTPLLAGQALAADLPMVTNVPIQPLAAQVKRLVSAMDLLGEPFDGKTKAALKKAGEEGLRSRPANLSQTQGRKF